MEKKKILIEKYFDNSSLTARHKSVPTSISKIALVFKKVEQLTDENEIVFDPTKFEATYFFRKCNLSN